MIRHPSNDVVPTPKLIYVIDVIRLIRCGWFRTSRSAAFLRLIQETR